MTARRSWTVRRDGCGENIGSSDLGDHTAGEARAVARMDGAHVNLPGGRDLCATCWDTGARSPRTRAHPDLPALHPGGS